MLNDSILLQLHLLLKCLNQIVAILSEIYIYLFVVYDQHSTLCTELLLKIENSIFSSVLFADSAKEEKILFEQKTPDKQTSGH